ncbi:MAG TPA: di-trans,poly-cis-decaprenylcistransferase [Bryobacteraceae bacterium]|jgi:undecaprenyl diphosphate synthase|nr:di-trans,poly-cis-decaprenylcistransferase [Bryobacteraceae bacterium]
MSDSIHGLHAAIIMDGNGRWASLRGLPRIAGHKAGAEALRRTVETAPQLGIGILTVYAFSSDNWKRPREEVNALMRLFLTYLRREQRRCLENGVRVSVIGRRDRLPGLLVPAMEECERATAGGRRLHLRLAVDYSSRDAILAAAAAPGALESRDNLGRALGSRDVDLLIRTGGEQRLSDFLLWECAYAELVFASCLWPDFRAADLEAAVADFHSRERRFGALPSVVSSLG